jgi:hypothetical protein
VSSWEVELWTGKNEGFCRNISPSYKQWAAGLNYVLSTFLSWFWGQCFCKIKSRLQDYKAKTWKQKWSLQKSQQSITQSHTTQNTFSFEFPSSIASSIQPQLSINDHSNICISITIKGYYYNVKHNTHTQLPSILISSFTPKIPPLNRNKRANN